MTLDNEGNPSAPRLPSDPPPRREGASSAPSPADEPEARAAFGTLATLAGPDDGVILLLAEDDGTPTSGDRFTCVSSAFLL